MRAIEMLSDEIPPLLHTDTGEKVLLWMDEFKVSHLPVLKHGNFVGVVSESAVLDHLNLDSDLDHLFDHLPRPFVLENTHIYDILLRMSNEKLSVLPVLSETEEYKGCISIYGIMSILSNFGSLKEHGGVLVLEMNSVDYSLAQIAQIVESNNAKILSSFITSSEDSTRLEVTLKINQSNLSAVIRTFERYEYTIKEAFQDKDAESDLRRRYEALMNFMKF
ncbi:MAG: CBS domain-containing protein [Flavobacteriia bacterium]|nr:CBS domain-containing protein [Flavobacteriia bacterium]NBX38145.1 CBS domain-containing protein [Flavobacteriia bacterium]